MDHHWSTSLKRDHFGLLMLTEWFRQRRVYVMEVTIAEAAAELGVDVRTVREHVLSGRLQVARQVGRTQLLEHAGVRALGRAAGGRGRRWAAGTAWAALELLDTGTTSRLVGSERSRLRARLRGLEVAQLAHLAAGRGRLRRFTQLRGDREQLRSGVLVSGVSVLEVDELAEVFDLSAGGSRVTMGYVHDLAGFALRRGLVESAEGEVFLRGLAEGESVYLGLATYALDLYELGDARESSAGARYLSARLL